MKVYVVYGALNPHEEVTDILGVFLAVPNIHEFPGLKHYAYVVGEWRTLEQWATEKALHEPADDLWPRSKMRQEPPGDPVRYE